MKCQKTGINHIACSALVLKSPVFYTGYIVFYSINVSVGYGVIFNRDTHTVGCFSPEQKRDSACCIEKNFTVKILPIGGHEVFFGDNRHLFFM